MSNFNFYNFLEEKVYQRERSRESSATTFCPNYQKELTENIWNSLRIHKDKIITGASPKDGLVFKEIFQPRINEDADLLLKQIEQYEA